LSAILDRTLKSYFVRKLQIVQASIGGAAVGACGPNRVTLREMLNEWAGHDLMQAVQAERVSCSLHRRLGPMARLLRRPRAGAVGTSPANPALDGRIAVPPNPISYEIQSPEARTSPVK
jgi:hypothetical protein